MQSPADGISSPPGMPSRVVASSEAVPFFSVSPVKLGLLYFCTGGLYGTYWFYKNWKMIKSYDATEQHCMPLLRALLASFLSFFLFNAMRVIGRGRARFVAPVNAVQLAIGYFLINVVLGIVAEIFPPAMILMLFGFVFLLPIQRYANQVNEAVNPAHPRNNRLSQENWMVIVFCLPLVLFWCYCLLRPLF